METERTHFVGDWMSKDAIRNRITYIDLHIYIHTSMLPNIPYFIYMLRPRFVCFNVTVS
jgi:hypothetical protein